MTDANSAAKDGFEVGIFRGQNGLLLPYRLYVPNGRVRGKSLPLVVFLHGIAGAGVDNQLQIDGGNRLGSHIWTTHAVQTRHPAYVLAPQMPVGSTWARQSPSQLAPHAELLLELLPDLLRKYSVDADRIYVVGQSLGGMGVWDIISKRPNLFAAAVPVCGDGDIATIAAAKPVPVWAFHGAKDDVVPVSGSRQMVAALRAAGGTVKYTEYSDGRHDVWTIAFADSELPEWLFSQKRRPP
jgi:predicted peptidase